MSSPVEQAGAFHFARLENHIAVRENDRRPPLFDVVNDVERIRIVGSLLDAACGGRDCRNPTPWQTISRNHFKESLRRRETFALESTLSGLTYVRLFRWAKRLGYEIELQYLWLSSPAQAVARVRQRVRMGGHDVPEPDIRRRFKRSLANLVDYYLPLATRWAVWDNRGLVPKRLAFSAKHDIETVRRLIAL